MLMSFSIGLPCHEVLSRRHSSCFLTVVMIFVCELRVKMNDMPEYLYLTRLLLWGAGQVERFRHEVFPSTHAAQNDIKYVPSPAVRGPPSLVHDTGTAVQQRRVHDVRVAHLPAWHNTPRYSRVPLVRMDRAHTRGVNHQLGVPQAFQD